MRAPPCRRIGVLAVAALALLSPAPLAAAAAMPTAPSLNVTTAGGVLGTPDGAFAMVIPPNVLSPGYNLGIIESGTAPGQAPALPAGLQALSPYFVLAGYSMSAPQVATIQYNAGFLGTTPPAALSVYGWRGGAGWVFQPTAVNAGAHSVQVDVAGPETLVVLVSRAAFSDVPAGFWAGGAITTMLATGVMEGLGGGVFGPGQPVTRAEFAKMLTIGLALAPASGAPPFTDVPAGAWYAPYVAAVAQAGVMNGVTATTFDPNGPVTREQLAVLLMRALKLQPRGSLGFADAAQVDAWAVSGVLAAVAGGLMTGYPDGTFQPLAPVTRAQAAAVLARVIAGEVP